MCEMWVLRNSIGGLGGGLRVGAAVLQGGIGQQMGTAALYCRDIKPILFFNRQQSDGKTNAQMVGVPQPRDLV